MCAAAKPHHLVDKVAEHRQTQTGVVEDQHVGRRLHMQTWSEAVGFRSALVLSWIAYAANRGRRRSRWTNSEQL